MEVNVHARNVQLNGDYKEAARSKISHAARFFDNTGDADVEVSEEPNPRRADQRYRVEITTRAAGQTVRVEAASATAESALDLAVDRFGKQLRRMKERLVKRSRNHRPPPVTAIDSPLDQDEDERIPNIVKVKQFVMKPMTPEEAILQMDLLGHGFFFFHNAESDLPSVLYRRRDGDYGLIEPA